jgi:hypothetical protein
MSHLPPRGTLESLAVRLSAAPPVENELHATVNGVTIIVRYALRSAGSSSVKSTQLGVRARDLAGPSVRFFLDVRPAQAFEAAEVRSGRLRDIILGDPAFDDAFIVEAAPRDLLELVFDAAVRTEMLALLPLRIFSSEELAIEIEREGWIEDVEVLERLTRLAARLGGSIGPAAHAAAEARRAAPVKGGYRDGPPTPEEIEQERDEDLRALGAQREQRQRRDRRIAMGAILAVFVAIGAVIATVAALSGHAN